MNISALPIFGSYKIDLMSKKDSRGVFIRVFSLDFIRSIDSAFTIVQINQSLSVRKGTIRGLHMQRKPKEEAKIMQCIKGKAFDVIVDLRQNSPTYGKWHGTVIDEESNFAVFVPKGCAHGFQALTANTIMQYPTSEFYSPEYEIGIRWNDPAIGIKWPVERVIVSDKDKSWKNIVI